MSPDEALLGLQVPPNYDSLLGKLIVWAEDRPQAIARMKRALNECVISGVPTTCLYHTMILDLQDFKNGNVDTGFIQKHQEELSTPKMPPTKSVSKHSLVCDVGSLHVRLRCTLHVCKLGVPFCSQGLSIKPACFWPGFIRPHIILKAITAGSMQSAVSLRGLHPCIHVYLMVT